MLCDTVSAQLYHYFFSLHQDGVSSLMCASTMGHVEVAEMLLQHGASVDLVDEVG